MPAVVALAFLFYGLILSLWWKPVPNLFEVELKSLDRADLMQVYYRYDRSGMRSYHEYLSTREYVHSALDPLTIRFALPGHSGLLGLRWDPATRDNVLVIESIRLIYRNLVGSHILQEWKGSELPELWTPNEMVESTKTEGDFLRIQTQAPDPFFVFTDEALKLEPVLGSIDIWTLRGQHFLFYSFLAGLLFFIVHLFQNGWISRCGTAQTPKWNRYYPLLFLIWSLLLAGLVYYPFLLLDKLYLYADAANDTIDAFWPGFMHISELFRTDGWPLWSFSVGVGKGVFGWVGDPFLLLVYALPPEQVAFGLGWIQFLKVVFAAFFFFAYFRLLGLGKYAASIGALGLAFSAHMILRGNWYHYATEVVMVSFALFSFECYLKKRIWQLLPLAIAFLVLRGVFHTYVWSQMFLSYALLRLWMENGFRFSLFRDVIGKMGVLYLLGIGLTAVLLLPNAYELFTSTRVTGQESGIAAYASTSLFALNTPWEWLSAFYGLFSPDLLGRSRFYSGWQNYLEGPHLYAGLLVLLLVPQVFFQRGGRTRIALLLVVLLIAAYMLFPYVRYYLNGFSGNYYKTSSFWISVALGGMAALSLDNLIRKKVLNVWILIGCTIFYIWALAQLTQSEFVQSQVTVAEGFPLLEQIRFLLVAYTILLILIRWNILRPLAVATLLVLVSWEMVTFASGTVRDREILRGDTVATGGLYFDDSYRAVREVKLEDDSFYRLEKDVVSVHLNDALAQNYRGFRSYHSFNSSSYYDFLAEEGFGIDFRHRGFGSSYIAGFRGRFLLETLLSNKYYLICDSGNQPPPGYVYKQTVGSVRIYQNENFLPFGFLYTKAAPAELVRELNPPEARDLIALQAIILYENDIRKAPIPLLPDEAYGEAEELAWEPTSAEFLDFYQEASNALRQNHLQITSFNNNHFTGTIQVDEPSLLFLSIPFDRGWTVEIDGKRRPLLRAHFGFSAIQLQPGEKTVNISYFPPMKKTGAVISVISLLLFITLLILGSRASKWLTLSPDQYTKS